jgi:hypothetical protein
MKEERGPDKSTSEDFFNGIPMKFADIFLEI